MLPEEVLKRAADEMLNYQDSGQSVMEMSHRSKNYEAIIAKTEADLREIMNIPANYKVLFLQGGASLQFAMIPLNLLGDGEADYIITGEWAKKAAKEAEKFGKINKLASSEDKVFNYIPTLDKSKFTKDAKYFHICSNNTIFGTRFAEFPDTGSVPLVADMSSEILSRKIDVSKFGIIYAGAQKNMGPSGVTVVIIREDLVGNAPATVPTMLNYKTHVDNGSMFNTPPCYSIYICGLVFEWIKKMGGIEAVEKMNIEKANILYNFLDNSKLFKATVADPDRSLMNIPFVTGNEELDGKFVKEATAAGFVNLKGHRSVGGMRASIYNAMPKAGVEALVKFMTDFETANAK
jgi:phosphoserine aminotransferase